MSRYARALQEPMQTAFYIFMCGKAYRNQPHRDYIASMACNLRDASKVVRHVPHLSMLTCPDFHDLRSAGQADLDGPVAYPRRATAFTRASKRERGFFFFWCG